MFICIKTQKLIKLEPKPYFSSYINMGVTSSTSQPVILLKETYNMKHMRYTFCRGAPKLSKSCLFISKLQKLIKLEPKLYFSSYINMGIIPSTRQPVICFKETQNMKNLRYTFCRRACKLSESCLFVSKV